jgi:hypothetical protein
MSVACAVIALAAALLGPRDAEGAVRCTRYASTNGHDTSNGERRHPFRTVRHLMGALRAGETGCLKGGTFAENVSLSRGGRRGEPITLTSMPGTTATLRGRLVVGEEANYVVFRRLRLNGRNSQGLASPFVDGDFVRFIRTNVTNRHQGICFILGSHTWGIARRTSIIRSRIHDCGELPATNHDHGIYVEAARHVLIKSNYIFDNADRGIQLYPDAQFTTIVHNVIDGNGSGIIFSGDGGRASSNNYVARNIITYARVRYNIESWWPSGNPVGTRNVVTNNCIWRGRLGNFNRDFGGYRTRNNVVVNPQYRDRAHNDFRLMPGSPCRTMGPQ